jgi:hypothetical protein
MIRGFIDVCNQVLVGHDLPVCHWLLAPGKEILNPHLVFPIVSIVQREGIDEVVVECDRVPVIARCLSKVLKW